MIRRYSGPVAILCGAILSAALPASASDQTFFDNGQFALRAADGGILEPAVPIYHNGSLIGGHNHKIVEAYRAPSDLSTAYHIAELVMTHETRKREITRVLDT